MEKLKRQEEARPTRGRGITRRNPRIDKTEGIEKKMKALPKPAPTTQLGLNECVETGVALSSNIEQCMIGTLVRKGSHQKLNQKESPFQHVVLFDEMDLVKPPPYGEEFPRVNLPSDSPHSSREGSVKDGEVYAKIRNKKLEEQYQLCLNKAAEENNTVYTTFKAVAPSPMTLQTVYKGNSMVCFEGDTSDSDCSEPLNNMRRFKDTLKEILKDAEERNQNIFWSQDGTEQGVAFCFLRFQKVLEARWVLVGLQRMEQLLLGNFVEAIPAEWWEFNDEFMGLYGPVNVESKVFEKISSTFKEQRLKMYIDLLERENKLLNSMLEYRLYPSTLSSLHPSITNYVKSIRARLEYILSTVSEAIIDMNPYTSPIRMDFFVLPRPLHPITAYLVRPKQMERLMEYNIKEEGILRLEGYNPAILDVGCTFSSKVIGDRSRWSYFKGGKTTRSSYKDWNSRLRNLRLEINNYPVGVEAKVFFAEFRKKYAFFDDETIIGKYGDVEGVYKLTDVFFPQTLDDDGDGRVILFHGMLEGMIVTPKEILFRIWQQILVMMEHNHNMKLEDFGEVYENFWGQPLYPLKWGFKNAAEFIGYTGRLFPGGVDPLKFDEKKVHKSEEKKESNEKVMEVNHSFEYVEGIEENEGLDSLFDYHLSQEWFYLDEPLPENYVFRLPDPLPFEFFD